jgi:putative MFS transporter
MLTALDVMLIGAVVRPIAVEWGLDIVVAGYLISIGFLGMFVGAIVFGRVSDIIGRRRTIIIVVILEAIFTALHGLAYDVYSMALLRFLAGIGLGAALPQPGIYISEYVPVKYRGRFLGIVETSWVYGALLSLLFPYLIIPSYGWRAAFIVGLLPLIIIPLVYLYLPESIRYLMKRGRYSEIEEILQSRNLISRDIKLESGEGRIVKYRVMDLFSSKYISRTFVLSVLWMALVYTYYAVFIWLPTIYATQFGMTIVKSLFWTIIITLFQVPGYYSAAFLLDRIGRKRVLVIYLVVSGLASLLLGLYLDPSWVFLWSAAISFFNLGAWAGLYTYTPELYPTEIRGVGSGFAASMGRIAGIIAPTLTAYLYTLSGLFGPYLVISLVHILAGIVVFVMGIETMGKTLEELTEL